MENHNPKKIALFHPGGSWLILETCTCAHHKQQLRDDCLTLEDDPKHPWGAADTIWLFTRLYGDGIIKLLKDLETVRP